MIRIISCTSSDMTLEESKNLNVELVPLQVMFGDEPYDSFTDVNFEGFYQKLESYKELPVTSQPSPAAFLAVYSRAKLEGDDVVVITISSKLSGTYQSAVIAQGMADYDKIHIIDTEQASVGQRLLVDLAVKLREEGKSAADIAAELEKAKKRVVLFAALDTLKYLRKGGRIPKTTEVIGTVIGIKPIITLNQGAIVMADKARGHAGLMANLFKLVSASGKFDPSMPIYFGYSNSDYLSNAFQKFLKQKMELPETLEYPIGAVIGTHVGPGALAIAYLVKEA